MALMMLAAKIPNDPNWHPPSEVGGLKVTQFAASAQWAPNFEWVNGRLYISANNPEDFKRLFYDPPPWMAFVALIVGPIGLPVIMAVWEDKAAPWLGFVLAFSTFIIVNIVDVLGNNAICKYLFKKAKDVRAAELGNAEAQMVVGSPSHDEVETEEVVSV